MMFLRKGTNRFSINDVDGVLELLWSAVNFWRHSLMDKGSLFGLVRESGKIFEGKRAWSSLQR
jgi:hypothetical protein